MSETKDEDKNNSMLNGEHWQDVRELVAPDVSDSEPKKRTYLNVLTEPASIVIILLLFFTLILPAFMSFASLLR